MYKHTEKACQDILTYLRSEHSATFSELCSHLGLKESTAKRCLQILRDEGFVAPEMCYTLSKRQGDFIRKDTKQTLISAILQFLMKHNEETRGVTFSTICDAFPQRTKKTLWRTLRRLRDEHLVKFVAAKVGIDNQQGYYYAV